jgi:hypothetical protein
VLERKISQQQMERVFFGKPCGKSGVAAARNDPTLAGPRRLI